MPQLGAPIKTLISRCAADTSRDRSAAAEGLEIRAQARAKQSPFSCVSCELAGWAAVFGRTTEKNRPGEWQAVLVSCAGGARRHDSAVYPFGFADLGDLAETAEDRVPLACGLWTDRAPAQQKE